MLSASFQRGSRSGKCTPMSPSHIAPSSASEWPSAPRPLSTRTPPRTSGRPSASLCVSCPMPTRYMVPSSGVKVSSRKAKLLTLNSELGALNYDFRQVEVARGRDFEVVRAALYYPDFDAESFDECAVVGRVRGPARDRKSTR